MVVVVFRSRLRNDADVKELGTLYERLLSLVVETPGFIAVKDFQAEDGEAVTLAEFDTLEHVAAWREQVDHKVAQERGRKEFFSEYRIQVCPVVRDYKFP